MREQAQYPDPATVRAALDIARRAPSVHNTQPWRWALAEHSVHLFADRSRQLPVIDHDGRELIIDRHVLALVEATVTRRSDRRPFLPDRVPDMALAQLIGAALDETVTSTVLGDPVPRREAVTALAHADRVERGNPMYTAELAEWTRGSRVGAVQGVPARNVPAPSAFPHGVLTHDIEAVTGRTAHVTS